MNDEENLIGCGEPEKNYQERKLSENVEELNRLNAEYKSNSNDFSFRQRAYSVWNRMSPNERHEFCLSCSKSVRTSRGKLSRPRKSCYRCEAGLNYSKREIANNITCPKCKSENCFANDYEEGTEVYCEDCGFHQWGAKE